MAISNKSNLFLFYDLATPGKGVYIPNKNMYKDFHNSISVKSPKVEINSMSNFNGISNKKKSCQLIQKAKVKKNLLEDNIEKNLHKLGLYLAPD